MHHTPRAHQCPVSAAINITSTLGVDSGAAGSGFSHIPVSHLQSATCSELATAKTRQEKHQKNLWVVLAENRSVGVWWWQCCSCCSALRCHSRTILPRRETRDVVLWAGPQGVRCKFCRPVGRARRGDNTGEVMCGISRVGSCSQPAAISWPCKSAHLRQQDVCQSAAQCTAMAVLARPLRGQLMYEATYKCPTEAPWL